MLVLVCKKLLLAATEQNVLASLNIRDGQIIWRRMLGDADKVNGLDIASGKYLITLSGGTTLRAWSITNGDLTWETRFPPFASPPTLDVTPIQIHHLQAKMLLIFGGLQLYGVSSADGEILWRTNTANASQGGKFSLRRVLTGEDKNSLYGVGFTGASGFCVWKIYLFTGRLVMQEAATIKANICTDELVVTKHTVIGLDCDGKTIFTGHIGPVNSFSIHKTPIQSIVPDAFGKARLLRSTLEGVFALQLTDQIVLIKIGKTDHNLKVLEIFERPAVISNTLELLGNKTSVMAVQHVGLVEDCKVALRIVTIEGDKDETSSHVLDLDCERGLVQQVHISGYLRKDKSCGFRALFVMEDHSLVFVQNSKVVWTREDGLAAIAAFVAEELPPKKAEIKHINGAHRHWFKGQIEKLMAEIKGRGAQEFSLKKKKGGQLKLVQDEHGFRRLLIVLTKGGKLFALHSGSSKIVWSLLISSFRKSIQKSKAVMLKLLPWYHSIEPAQVQNPMVLVVGNSGSKADGSGILAWVDSYTGTELHSVRLRHAIEDVLPLARNALQTENLYMLMDVKRNIHVFPTLPDSLKVFQGQDSMFVFPVVDVDKSVISGYGFNLSAQMQSNPEIPSSLVFISKKVWKTDFLQRSERLVAASEIDKVESNRVMRHDLCGVLRNTLMLVATTSISISKVGENDSFKESGLAFSVMDAMTGEIWHSVWHSKAQGPVHMVKDKNWFAYYFFDSQARSYKSSTLEILETNCEDFQNQSTVMNASALNQSKKGSRMLRSENAVNIPYIKALGFIEGSTENARRFLFGAFDGQITLSGMNYVNDTSKGGTISKWMRSLGSSLAQQLNLTSVGPVEGLRKIVSVPTMSGSIVFAYGIDILLVHAVLHHHTPSYLKGFSVYVVLATIGAILFAVLMTQILPRYKRSKKLGKHITR
ncbi:hypothetical protein GOP47_0003142 [Adiantum capillus-veneris]|uniref:EMC1 first beta-propeller domain-containing protein n=1 Tax=Adiantum capillus-veneris TaxID=13818 RepID=A0A9D4VBN3_ADICA|nr:hypothetical protein GOP47_0003142 [Adiantum capillus-veneris]